MDRVFRQWWSVAGLILALATLLTVAHRGSEADATLATDGVRWEPGQRFYRTLSEYNLFKDGARQIPNDGVIPYDLNTPLFTDYASKHRFIWMPEGTSAEYREGDPLDFPVGTIIAKTFGMLHDLRDPAQGERILETRLLIHQPDGWIALPYIWNDDATEAKLKVAGGTIDVAWIHSDGTERTNKYEVPNMNQCKGCHANNDVLAPIGPKARNINKDYAYAEGHKNQLTKLVEVGYLTGAPDPATASRLAVWDDPETGSVEERARAWLEANCMHCHNPKGPANTSGLDLRATVDVPAQYGVFKTPVAAGRGSGGMQFAIVPGKPEESFLMFRMESTDPGIMMPELGRKLVHEEGLALVREWIASMPESTPTS